MKTIKNPKQKLERLQKERNIPKETVFKRLRRFKKVSRQLSKLERLWERLIKNSPTKKNLIDIFKLRNENLQKRVWKYFSQKDDISLNDLYEMNDCCINDGALKEAIQEQVLDITNSPDELFEIIRNEGKVFSEKALEKLISGIKNGFFKKASARKALLGIIKEIPRLRKEALNLFKNLEPTDKELQEILDLGFIYSTPDLREEINKMLRKKTKRRKGPNAKIIGGITSVVEKIEKIQKGQG